MKRQYLGDSKDSFKWDYHDYLAVELGMPQLTVAFMLTPDDGTREGGTDPEWFPARDGVIAFCGELRARRELSAVERLCELSGATYEVALHRGGAFLTNANRARYFSGFDADRRQLVFLDPDNGFEPERSCTDKHVAYADVAHVLDQLSEDSVVSVFQHFRRIPFADDFARIRERLAGRPATAILWHQLMFVAVTRSRATLERVIAANARYAEQKPVKVIT